jgi:hypothetical protein
MMYPKLKYNRRVPQTKRNPVPTSNDYCIYCGTPYASTHEVFEGNGRRQWSIRYGLQVKLCIHCHKDVQEHPQQGRDLELKQKYQGKFEEEYSRELFIKTFTKSYL